MKKLTNYILIFAGASIAIVSQSCSPKYYSINTQNVPLMSSQGQTNLTVAGNGNQVEFQGAYGVTKNIAIQANGAFFVPADNDNKEGGSGKILEVGGGYFMPVNKDFVFETYALFGFGTMENHFQKNTPNGGDISANVMRFGIQPNFGYKSKNFEAAVSSRFVSVNYNNIKGDLIYGGNSEIAYLTDNKSNFLIEPAITLRAGLEKLKFQAQYGYSLNVSNSDFKQDKDNFTIGLNYRF